MAEITKRKPSKPKRWAGLKGTLPKWEGGDKSFIEKVNGERFHLANKKNVEVAAILRDLKERKAKLEEEESKLNVQIEACSSELADRFEVEDMQSLKMQSGETFSLEDVPYAVITDKGEVNKWFIENNMDEMRTVQWTSLNALVKELLESGKPLPSGVDVFLKSTVKMRKG
jgi:hypothetical protein